MTVRAGLGAFIAGLVLSLVGSVFSLLNFDNILDQALAQVDTSNVPNRDQALEFARSFAVIGVVIGFLILAVFALFVWFSWRGFNWARIVLWVLGGIQLVFGLIGLGLSGSNPIADAYPFLTALSWFEYLCTAAGVVLLALKPSNDWFRYRKWLRATGQPG